MTTFPGSCHDGPVLLPGYLRCSAVGPGDPVRGARDGRRGGRCGGGVSCGGTVSEYHSAGNETSGHNGARCPSSKVFGHQQLPLSTGGDGFVTLRVPDDRPAFFSVQQRLHET